MDKITFLSLLILFLGLASSCDDEHQIDDISKHYSYYDGPYLTFGKNPSSEICINYLTPLGIETDVSFGTDLTLDNLYHNSEPVIIHNACISDLTPDATYFYRINDGNIPTSDATIFSFHTPSTDATEFSFVIIGDMQPDTAGTIDSVSLVSESVLNEDFDFWIQLGDMTYRGSDAGLWHKVLSSFSILASQIPFVSVIGNHDWTYDNGKNWKNLMPFPFEDNPDGKYYSFDFKNVRFIMVDNFEISGQISDSQLEWIEKSLNETPAGYFKLLFFHHSIFSSGDENMYFDLQRQLVPLIDKYKVDAVFYGHDHMYEHYIYKYGENGLLHDPSHTWEHKTVHYFLSGGGGARLEYEYGLLSRSRVNYSRRWFNTFTDDWESVTYYQTAWNRDNFVEWAPEASSPNGKNYFHIPEIEVYQDESAEDGLEYGEMTLNYIKVDVTADSLVVTVKYPDGRILSGPLESHPQVWIITK